MASGLCMIFPSLCKRGVASPDTLKFDNIERLGDALESIDVSLETKQSIIKQTYPGIEELIDEE